MAFRFRKSARLGPLRFHFSKNGLSSISVGGRGASFNIPVNRSGGNRSTVGLPGTGLSWSVEHEADAARGLPNSRRLKPGQLDLLKQQCLQILHQELFAPGNDPLWQILARHAQDVLWMLALPVVLVIGAWLVER